MTRRIAILTLVLGLAAPTLLSQGQRKPPLTTADIDAITKLLMLEDTRVFDPGVIGGYLKSSHPEVRRRAALAIGRIGYPRPRATDAQTTVTNQARTLLATARGDADVEVAATVAFSTGQLKDPDAVGWLSGLMASATPPDVAREAACSLGKIRSPEARVALLKYLATAASTAAAAPVVGEALLSVGRFTGPDDLAPIVKWSTAKDVEVRWRATWALYRLRDAAAAETLIRLSSDPSPEVRFWAVRGLGVIAPPGAGPNAATPATPPPAPVAPEIKTRQAARLREAVRDSDRRVRTEALRALATYEDDASFDVVLSMLDSPDTWLSVSAAEALGRYPAHKDTIVPRLVAAAGPTRPTALRVTALTPLSTLAPDAAKEAATALAQNPSQDARTAAQRALQRIEAAANPSADAGGRGRGGAQGVGRGAARPEPPTLTEADYRRIVERWIVPDYNGAPKPHAIWTTPKGEIELELYPGDSPLGTEYFLHEIESGDIVGTEFGRVVPNFVAQQDGIKNAVTLRDEVNRRGLTRGNLSWASAGLDTGRPGYTLGSTPQPHNEGDFTSLGRVVRGMDVVDRLELGDAVTAAKMRQ
jgi:HEAT repeat protein/cyclophilin family peptidyl-prolyl cis-trans isomerase